jgi:hypothetical protein
MRTAGSVPGRNDAADANARAFFGPTVLCNVCTRITTVLPEKLTWRRFVDRHRAGLSRYWLPRLTVMHQSAARAMSPAFLKRNPDAVSRSSTSSCAAHDVSATEPPHGRACRPALPGWKSCTDA